MRRERRSAGAGDRWMVFAPRSCVYELESIMDVGWAPVPLPPLLVLRILPIGASLVRAIAISIHNPEYEVQVLSSCQAARVSQASQVGMSGIEQNRHHILQ